MAKPQTAEERARDLIRQHQTAMLTTVGDDGRLRSQPMTVKQIESDGDLYFLAADDAEQVREINREPQVSVTLSHAGEHTYLAVSGRACITRDRIRVRELWDPSLETTFPRGPEDPRLLLIKVEIEQGEFWDDESGDGVPFSKLTAPAGGDRGEPGDAATRA